MTAKELAEIEARANAATPGPWITKATQMAQIIAAVAPGKQHRIFTDNVGGVYPTNDRDFIASARTDVPALIAEVRRLKHVLSALAAAEECPDKYDLCNVCGGTGIVEGSP